MENDPPVKPEDDVGENPRSQIHADCRGLHPTHALPRHPGLDPGPNAHLGTVAQQNSNARVASRTLPPAANAIGCRVKPGMTTKGMIVGSMTAPLAYAGKM